MTRKYETQSTRHATEVARVLLDAADNPGQVRTVSGDNGRNAFEVDDDFPDIEVPEPPEEDEDRRRGRRGPVKAAEAEPEKPPAKKAAKKAAPDSNK